MEVKSFRARTMQEALALVRRDLGPTAAVLHTREVGASGLWRLIPGMRQIEVTASLGVQVPSRLPARDERFGQDTWQGSAAGTGRGATPADRQHPLQNELKGQLSELQSMVQELCRRTGRTPANELPEQAFRLFTDLIEADFSEEVARELIERVQAEAPAGELADQQALRTRLARFVESEIAVSGAIRLTPGRRRLVALVGPTGVGKTTTIAKLAANYRLREKHNVGLITVDTYRIAAVDQLRTYADIIDLPMKVVSTPREMREAMLSMSDLDLILLDTAGRSPKDEVKIQELKSFLAEAQADEVHLVLSSVIGATALERTAERFAAVGTTHLMLTKLDEATGLGNLLPLLRSSRLSVSYLTNGQNVPDDIEAARRDRLARMILGFEHV